MAVPKRKHSKSRRDKRRTHQKLTPPSLSKCEKCGEVRLPHNMCPECGHYKNRIVGEIAAA